MCSQSLMRNTFSLEAFAQHAYQIKKVGSVLLALNRDNGEIEYAFCECPSGSGASAHIAML